MVAIYHTQILTGNILCGLILIDEVKFYTSAQLLGLLLGALACATGILILSRKSKENIMDEDHQLIDQ